MLQNQINQKLTNNQIFQEKKGRLSIHCYHKRVNNSDYYNITTEKITDSDMVERLNEYDLQAGKQDYAILNREQRSHADDHHVHPYESENSPWRRQQNTVNVQANNTYTNRY